MSFWVCMSCNEEDRASYDLGKPHECRYCGSPYLRIADRDEEQKAADDWRKEREKIATK